MRTPRMARLLGVTRQSLHAKHRVPPPMLPTIPRDDWPAQHAHDAEGCRMLDRMRHPNDGIPW